MTENKPFNTIADRMTPPAEINKPQQRVQTMTHMKKNLVAIAIFALAIGAVTAQAAEPAAKPTPTDLEAVFRKPPESAKAGAFWFWINGHKTKAGITADLENKAKAGFGSAIIGNVGNRPGDIGERKATEDEQKFIGRTGAVAASRSMFIEEFGPVPGNLDKDHLALLRHAADEARRLGLTLGISAGWTGFGWSGVGGPWIKPKHAYKNINIAERKLKSGEVLRWTKPEYDPETGYGFVGVVAYRTPPAETAGAKPHKIAGADEKLLRKDLWTLFASYSGGPIPHGSALPEDATVDSASITNLTALIGTDGKLTWTAPAGDWTVLIATYAPNGNMMEGAGPQSGELACDRLDPAALDCHWENGVMPLLNALGDHVGTTFRCFLSDSEENMRYTWGAIVPELFQRLHGYDLTPWLPALTGRVVGDAERTERFLRDYRKTLEVGSNENFEKRMSEKCRAVGLQFVVEPYAGGTFGGFSFGAAVDVVTTEFWYGNYSPFRGWKGSGGDGSSRGYSEANPFVASIAHTTGKNLVTAESFSSYLSHHGAEATPNELKFCGNTAWCDGVNAFWMSAVPHNPYPGLRPGMYFGILCPNFNPNALPWRDQVPAYYDYIARNQALLQAGRYVADFLVHDPSELAVVFPRHFPAGYRYDIGIDDILLQISVRNGKLVLPSGMKYACLMFMSKPDHFNFRRLTPELLAHVAKLVEAGATVLGEKPLGSWTLKGGAAADQEYERLVNQLWAGYEAGKKGSRAQGKGKVWWGYTPDEWAAQVALPPDLGRDNSLMIDFIHRRDDAANADWYLVHSGEAGRTVEANVRFRVTGKIPELWDPVTGVIREAAVWREKDGVTEVPLAFPVNGSEFVVFRKPSTGRDPLTAFTAVKPFGGVVDSQALVLKDGRPGVLAFESGRFTGTTKSGETVAVDVTAPAPVTLEGAWTLKFDPELGGPAEPVVFDKLASLHTHADAKIKYYSGPVSYKKTIDIPAELLGEGKRLMLDLGRVVELAEVKLNGKSVAVAWCAPFAVDLTAVAKAGANELEIIAVDKWRNRWIGDEQLPPDVDTVLPQFGGLNRSPVKFPDWAKQGKKSPNGRILFSTFMPFTKGDPLGEAGLLGPVTLRGGVEAELK